MRKKSIISFLKMHPIISFSFSLCSNIIYIYIDFDVFLFNFEKNINKTNQMGEEKIKIGITHGDINGIGYEVILKSLHNPTILEIFTPILYGSSKVAGFYKKYFDIPLNFNIISNANQAIDKRVNLIDCVGDDVKVEVGKIVEENGAFALKALEKATADLESNAIQAVVTAPINKLTIQSESFSFPGHTEYFEKKFSTDASSLMLLVSDCLRIAVVTGHIPIREVAERITKDMILKKIKILNESLKQDFSIIRPRIAVLGLNPHAGDNGVIGNEDSEIIVPAIKDASESGMLCFGPFPADGFFGSGNFKKYDAVLAMYHDQGLIPFKNMAMETGVNFTAGLPIVRTSPDHGTAYDIAGKNIASELSFQSAIYLAIDVVKNRAWNKEINKNPLPITTTNNNRKNSIE